eukprot:515998_1
MRLNSTSDVSIQLLKSIFGEQLEHKDDNKDRMESIVNALGGINNILGIILNSNDENILNHKQKQLLYQTLKTPKTTHKDIDNDRNHRVELVLDSTDNYLLKWFGDKNDISLKIYYFIHHRVTVSLILLLWIIWWILFFTVKPIIWEIVWVFCSIFIWIPFLILYAASVNRVAFQRIIRKTDFWIKIFYVNKWIASLLWFWIKTNLFSLSFGLFSAIFAGISNNIVLLIISSFDGFKGNRKTKLVLSTLAGLVFVIFYLFSSWQSYSNENDPIDIITIYGDIKISLLHSMSSSAQIVAIFMFKQCFLAFYFKKQAVSIVYRPFIVWKQEQQRVIENKTYNLMQPIENNHEKELIINN